MHKQRSRLGINDDIYSFLLWNNFSFSVNSWIKNQKLITQSNLDLIKRLTLRYLVEKFCEKNNTLSFSTFLKLTSRNWMETGKLVRMNFHPTNGWIRNREEKNWRIGWMVFHVHGAVHAGKARWKAENVFALL